MHNVFSRLKPFIPLLILISLVLVLRVPNLYEPYWHKDEGMYLTIGQALNRGAILYQDIIDHKTPLIYFIAAINPSLTFIKSLLILSSLISVTVFYLLAQKITPIKGFPFILTLTFALATTLPRFEGHIFNGEMVMLPFILLGHLLFWRNFPTATLNTKKLSQHFRLMKPKHPLAIGLLFGLAFLTKVPSGFELATVILFILSLIYSPGLQLEQLIRYLGLVLVGFLIPIIASLMYFGFRQALSAYIINGLLYNFFYISSWQQSATTLVSQILTTIPARLLLLTFYLMIIIRFTKTHTSLRYLLIWLGCTLTAATLSLRPYPHYFIQVMPSLILILGTIPLVPHLQKVLALLSILTVVAIVSSLNLHPYKTKSYYQSFSAFISQKISFYDYTNRFDAETGTLYQVSYWLKTHSLNTDTIYIHGDLPNLYALSRRKPASPYTADYHVNSFDAYDQVAQILRTKAPKYIIDLRNERNSFPQLYQLLDTHYITATTINHVRIYRYLHPTTND